MSRPEDMGEAIATVISGALRLWGVDGDARPDGDAAWVVTEPGHRGIRIARAADADTYGTWWLAAGEASGARPCRGLHGLLRALRAELCPEAPRGRLIVGASDDAAGGAGHE